jgi:hypothetical protein
MEQVGAEASFADLLAQIAVGGGDDPGAAHPLLGFADALEFAVLQHPQQLRLQVEGQLADLVEEEGAVLGVLEIAGLGLDGAGEGALGIAEQRRFDQIRRDGGAVEREIGLVAAPGQPVQAAAGDDLLAAAGFALDQDREGGIGVLADLGAQLLHGHAVAEQAAGVLGDGGFGGLRCRLVGQNFLQYPPQLFRVGRLGDEIDRPERAGVAGVGIIVLARQHDDLDVRRMGQQVGDKGEAFVRLMRPRRQAEVDQGQAGRAAAAAQQVDAVAAGTGGADVEFAAEEETQGVDDEGVVIDDQEGRLAGFRVGHASACPMHPWPNYIRPANGA